MSPLEYFLTEKNLLNTFKSNRRKFNKCDIAVNGLFFLEYGKREDAFTSAFPWSKEYRMINWKTIDEQWRNFLYQRELDFKDKRKESFKEFDSKRYDVEERNSWNSQL